MPLSSNYLFCVDLLLRRQVFFFTTFNFTRFYKCSEVPYSMESKESLNYLTNKGQVVYHDLFCFRFPMYTYVDCRTGF